MKTIFGLLIYFAVLPSVHLFLLTRGTSGSSVYLVPWGRQGMTKGETLFEDWL